jgi:3-methyladenine DNA glycosylase/8-oxoguanine DNA glycosylase
MPAADLGIRRGVQLTDGLRAVATPKQVLERSRAWRPYRSMHLFICGRPLSSSLDRTISAKEKSDDRRPSPR